MELASLHHSITPSLQHSNTPLSARLTNESPVRTERPVNKQTASDEVLLRHRPPVAAVVTVVTVVAEREVAVRRHRKGAAGLAQIVPAQRITVIGTFASHHPLETVPLRFVSIDEQKWWNDPLRVARSE